LADGLEGIFKSDERDHDMASSRGQREDFVQQLAALDSRVGEVADRILRIVGTRILVGTVRLVGYGFQLFK
jgi:hypothetical protein